MILDTRKLTEFGSFAKLIKTEMDSNKKPEAFSEVPEVVKAQ